MPEQSTQASVEMKNKAKKALLNNLPEDPADDEAKVCIACQ